MVAVMRNAVVRLPLLTILACVSGTALGQQNAPSPARGAPTCVDISQSPDYIPGIDATGRKVAPADLPSEGDLNVNPDLYVGVPTGSSQSPNVGVEVDASAALAPKTPCPAVRRNRSVNARPR